jgi:hypothetical protein
MKFPTFYGTHVQCLIHNSPLLVVVLSQVSPVLRTQSWFSSMVLLPLSHILTGLTRFYGLCEPLCLQTGCLKCLLPFIGAGIGQSV